MTTLPRVRIFLLFCVGLFIGCGGDETPSSTDPTHDVEVSPARSPAYPPDEGIGGLLPAEPQAAVEALEAAQKAAEDRETARARAEAAAKAPPEPTPLPEDLIPLEVTTAVLAKDVKDRIPVGEGVVFKEGTDVHCFNRLANPGGTQRTVRHRWLHEGERRSTISLKVKGTSWRTWSSRPVYGPGSWRVEILDEAGTVLQSLPFTVER